MARTFENLLDMHIKYHAAQVREEHQTIISYIPATLQHRRCLQIPTRYADLAFSFPSTGEQCAFFNSVGFSSTHYCSKIYDNFDDY